MLQLSLWIYPISKVREIYSLGDHRLIRTDSTETDTIPWNRCSALRTRNNIKAKNRYTIEFVWKGKSIGHIVQLFNNGKGVLSIYDPQNGINTRGDTNVLEYIKKIKPSSIQLLDVQNYDINMNVVNKILQEVKT